MGVFWLAFGFVLLAGSYLGYSQARKKGCRPPAAFAVLLAGCALGIAGAVVLAPTEKPTHFLLFLWISFGVPLLLSAVAVAIIIMSLPHRTLRYFGEQRVRFPIRRFGQALLVLGVLLILTFIAGAVLHGKPLPVVLALALPCGIAFCWIGLMLLLSERRLHAPSLEQFFRDDPRPPVLYMRAFNQESQFFIIGRKAEYGSWCKAAALAEDHQMIGITEDEYLADEIAGSLGPFVALGSPEDYLAPPGALRTYAKDEDWKMRFDELARESICVIVAISKSDNLRWEFEHLRSEGLQEKLFVLSRPSTEGTRLAWALWGLLWRLKGIQTATWSDFSADLTRLGYEITFRDPGFGAVLGFDAAGKGFVLTTEANWPKDFIEPIRAWIVERRKVGNCVPNACRKCDKEFYASPSTPQPLCRDCSLGASRAKSAWIRFGWTIFGVVFCFLPVGTLFALIELLPEVSFWVLTVIFLVVFALMLAGLILGSMYFGRDKRSDDTVDPAVLRGD
jgi:hypothetical protein